ncbi:YcgL domain-containing protein [Thiomicrospira sp. ALE5]|uniref:YcgL domain-containing protein n=1 Tax=Thiomicrospira sp. ALE5 TaxID=748650 RepID=UPI0008E34EE0|nr:YcgL domain-containing protein [Thiomicrospira sp. ALE5]SFR64182.1 hypothetical protein SAMN03092900_2000 [Thiomicrospira sp. ALE5]
MASVQSSLAVSAYKSSKKDELYIMVPQTTQLSDLPQELLVMFGEAKHVLDFEMTPTRKMGREDPTKVWDALQTKGYFIQLPPQEVEKIGDMAPPPERLDNIF